MKQRIRIASMLAGAAVLCSVIPAGSVSAVIWTAVGSETET